MNECIFISSVHESDCTINLFLNGINLIFIIITLPIKCSKQDAAVKPNNYSSQEYTLHYFLLYSSAFSYKSSVV